MKRCGAAVVAFWAMASSAGAVTSAVAAQGAPVIGGSGAAAGGAVVAPRSSAAVEDGVRPVPDPGGIINFVIENDSIAGTDQHYTNGFRFSVLTSEWSIPEWLERGANFLPFFDYSGNKRISYAFGQSMFTPNDITISNPPDGERPYAGWLYGSIGLVSDTGSRLDNLQLTLGIVGPYSGAKDTQKIVHELIGSPDPKGWATQLKTEPGVVLSYERKWRGLLPALSDNPTGLAVDATPHAGVSLGNIYTHANFGLTLRVGQDLPADYGPPRVRPSLPGSDFFVPSERFGWYLFAGVDGRAVAHNIFLDGNTWKDSRSVDKEYFVGELQAGLVVTFANMRLGYTHVLRSKEFETQDGFDEFGALTFGFRF
ncbi:lipid A 3-O-deacylase [Constrictibacter sp. MBR-5]|jgi:hypothetical protein